MSYPFGGTPMLAEYIQWIVSQGGSAQSGLMGNMTMTKITMPTGKSVTIAGISQMERVFPSSISNYDRRLGVKSPWHKS